MRILMNPLRVRGLSHPETLVAGETATDPSRALALLSSCPVYSATPLLARDALAKALGIGALHIKDERSRMGLGSFKALGASFAIAARAEERKGAKLLQPGVAGEALEGETFVTASAGNHGLSVAAGARAFAAHRYRRHRAGAGSNRRARAARLDPTTCAIRCGPLTAHRS